MKIASRFEDKDLALSARRDLLEAFSEAILEIPNTSSPYSDLSQHGDVVYIRPKELARMIADFYLPFFECTRKADTYSHESERRLWHIEDDISVE